MNATLTTFSAKDAKARFGEVLDEALGSPVGITRHERLTAYVVSKRDFESMMAKVQELEDQLWLAKADAARSEGFASAEDVDAFLHDFRNTNNEVINDQTSPEILTGAGR
ncbi:MAG: type II toxin-antitoxin system Phd/YefM family antitoxin [Methylophilaceae bacterium]